MGDAATPASNGRGQLSRRKTLDSERFRMTRPVMLSIVSLCFSSLANGLTQNMIMTSLPRIASQLDAEESISWVVTGFSLSVTSFQPLWVAVSDVTGRRATIATGMVIFTAFSLLCGLAPSFGALVAGRTLQGLGGGMLQALQLVILSELLPPRERPTYQTLFSLTMMVSSVVGPLIGGWLTQNYDWRSLFHVSAGLGAVALLGFVFFLKETYVAKPDKEPPSFSKIDYFGSVLWASTTSLLLLSLQFSGELWEWASWQTAVAFSLVFLGIAAFVFWESRTANPLIPLHIFKNRNVALVVANSFLGGMSVQSLPFFMPFFLQTVWGDDPISSGTHSIPMRLTMIFTTIAAGMFITRTGIYVALNTAGLLVVAGGVYLLSTLSRASPLAEVLGFQVATGVGLGVLTQPMSLAMQSNVARADLAASTVTRSAVQGLGGVTGISLLGAVMNELIAAATKPVIAPILRSFPWPEATLQAVVTAFKQGGLDAVLDLRGKYPEITPGQMEQLREGMFEVNRRGLQGVFLGLVPVVLLASVLSFCIKHVPLSSRDPSKAKGEAAPAPAEASERTPLLADRAPAAAEPDAGSVERKRPVRRPTLAHAFTTAVAEYPTTAAVTDANKDGDEDDDDEEDHEEPGAEGRDGVLPTWDSRV
ncbi:major facilitator superfamily domain-containing protein [Hyaloraphidium curvatum]|nr:major facilitator superfamily domain-containing protein [Hyaloraphidium curvatum]